MTNTLGMDVCDQYITAGLHLEIDPRGGKMSIYEKEGGRSPVYMRG